MNRADRGWLMVVLVAGAFALVAAETFLPLRRTREPKRVRTARNLTIGGLAFAVAALAQAPLIVPLTAWTVESRFGLLGGLVPSSWSRIVATFLLLDYTTWTWHWINHRVPLFWRFHRVHHVDRDMDASTGIRFHFGELALSSLFRAGQIVVIGADPAALGAWQTVLFVCVLFHHSNTRLPVGLERALVHVLVTPRMHGIHHSDYRSETDSNWSSILSVWDRLHGTLRLDVPQDAIEIGVPAYQRPEDVTLGRALALPFLRRRDDWVRQDGRGADREPFGRSRRLHA